MGRDLLIEHLQEIFERHVPHTGIHAAIAAAVAAREVAAQRTFPEERIEPVLGDGRGVKVGKNIEGQTLAQPQAATGHGLLPPFGSLLALRVHIGRVVGGFLGYGVELLVFGRADRRLLERHADRFLSGRANPVHHHHARGRNRIPDFGRSGFLSLFALALGGRIPDRGTGCRESQQGRKCEFQFFVHIASTLKTIFRTKIRNKIIAHAIDIIIYLHLPEVDCQQKKPLKEYSLG